MRNSRDFVFVAIYVLAHRANESVNLVAHYSRRQPDRAVTQGPAAPIGRSTQPAFVRKWHWPVGLLAGRPDSL